MSQVDDDGFFSPKKNLKEFKSMSVAEFTGTDVNQPAPDAPPPVQEAAPVTEVASPPPAIPEPVVAQDQQPELPLPAPQATRSTPQDLSPEHQEELTPERLVKNLSAISDTLASSVNTDIDKLRLLEKEGHGGNLDASEKAQQLTNDIKGKIMQLVGQYEQIKGRAANMRPPITLPDLNLSLDGNVDPGALQAASNTVQAAISDAESKIGIQETVQVVVAVEAAAQLASTGTRDLSALLTETAHLLDGSPEHAHHQHGGRSALAKLDGALDALLEGKDGQGQHPHHAGHDKGKAHSFKEDVAEITEAIKERDPAKLAHTLEDIAHRDVSSGLKGMPDKALKAALSEFVKLQNMGDGSQYLAGATTPPPELSGFNKRGMESLPGAPVIKMPTRGADVALPA